MTFASSAKTFASRVTPISSRRVLPDSSGRFPPLSAGLLAVGIVGAVALVALAQPSPRDDEQTEDWYENLDKSSVTPPDFVFGVVWPAIEAACAYAAFRLLSRRSSSGRNGALALLGFNLLNIPAFTKLFFGEKNLKGATLSSFALLAGSWGFVASAWRSDRWAALAGVPLAAWVTFASYLQEEILRRNDPDVRQMAARMAGA